MHYLKHILLTFILSITALIGVANNEQLIDSLKAELEHVDNIDDRIQLLFDIAWEYKSSDPYKAIAYANKCMEVAKTVNDKQGIASCYSVIGVTYGIIGDYKEALNYDLKALKITQELKDEARISIALNNIGNVYYNMGQWADAIKYYKKSLAIKVELGDEAKISSSLNNMANVYRDIGELDSSLFYHTKSLAIDQKINNKLGEAMNMNNIGMVYHRKGQYEKAQPYLLKSIEILKPMNETNNLIIVYNSIALNAMQLKSLDEAEAYALKCLKIAEKIGLKKEIRAANGTLSEIFEQKGDFKSSLEYFRKYKLMNDSILNKSIREKVSELEVQYDTHQKQREIALLSSKNKIQELQLKNRNYSIIGLAIVVLILLLVSYGWVQQSRLKNRMKVQALEQKFLRAQMNPHFIFNALNSIQSCILHEDKKVAYSYHSKFAKLLRMILMHSREDIIPIKDDIEALKLYMDIEALRTDEKFTYEIIADAKIEMNNYSIPPLIIQPFVENAIWHGIVPKENGDGKIIIELSITDNVLKCSVEDNGVGRKKSFENKRQDKNHQSIGMSVTKERLELYNLKNKNKLSVNIIDLPNNSGTRVEAFISIKEKTV